MFNYIYKKLTNNFDEVPLFIVTFNLNKYKNEGAKNSCMVKIHPELNDDEYIHNTLQDLIDYIRDNYDMEDVSE